MSALLGGITSHNNGDFYCINCLHSFRTENKLKKHKNVCGNHDYSYAEMPKKDNKILKCNHGEKSMKVLFTIYADLDSLLEKMNTYNNPKMNTHNNPKKLSATKINKHTASGYSLLTHCLFDTTKNMFDYYRGKNCMKNFCLDLKEQAKKIINCEKKRNDVINKRGRENTSQAKGLL